MSEDKENKAKLEAFKAIYDDKCATINGRDYVIGDFNHAARKIVCSFFSTVKGGDVAFITSPEFEKAEKIMFDRILFDGMQLSKLPKHWDEYPEDYLPFIGAMMGAISYPLLRGSLGD